MQLLRLLARFANKRFLLPHFFQMRRKIELSETKKTLAASTLLEKMSTRSTKTCGSEVNETEHVDRRVGLGTTVMSVVGFLHWLFSLLVLGPAQNVWKIIFGRSSNRNLCYRELKTSRVFVVNSLSSCDRLLQLYWSKYPHKLNFLGLDCEWVSVKDQRNCPVALLQIATPLSDCFLVRLCKMDGRLPQTVKEILEDRNVLKFGVGIQDDAKRLRATYGVDVCGCVDLRHVVQRCRVDDSTQSRANKMGLNSLARMILGVTMDKSWKISCSNWELEQLGQRQIEYAMNDALVASHMFLRLVQSKGDERKVPRPDHVSKKDESTSENNCNFVEGESSKDEDFNVRNHDNKSDHTAHSVAEDDSVSKMRTLMKEAIDENCVSEYDSPSSKKRPKLQARTKTDTLNRQENNMEISNSGDSISSLASKSLQSCLKEQDKSVRVSDKTAQMSVDLRSSYCEDPDDELDELITDISKCESVNETGKGYLNTAEVKRLLEDSVFCQRATSLCQGIVDLSFKNKKLKVPKECGKNKEDSSGKPNGKPYKRGTMRKTPLYMNCMLVAPDGSKLCTVDRKKADWYIEKGIGELTNSDPYTVQLKFEPSGRPGEEDSYYLNFKDNICVVCGVDKIYMRKNIVPHDYRRHFPLFMKDHHSHDILLMCPNCHCASNTFDDQMRKKLAKQYDAPLGNATVARLIQDPDLMRVKSAAKALNYGGNQIPEKRYQELVQIVQDYFKVTELTPDLLSEAVTMETHKENSNFVSHGQEVVKRVRLEGKLLEFEKMWRQHFLDTMRPQYLPPLWSVDHRHVRLKGNLEETEEL